MIDFGFDIPSVLIAAWLMVLFLQSGLDKVINWGANLDWLKGHFSKSFLAKSVPLLLLIVTLLEVTAGLLSLAGIVQLVTGGGPEFAFYGACVSGLSLLCLFTGQRIAQDYEGAASLVPYFLLCLAAMYWFGL